MIWRIINLINAILIIIVIIWSDEFTYTLNTYRDYLYGLDTPTDWQVVVRFALAKWEGVSIALNLVFVFLARRLYSLLSGAIKKVSQ